MIGPVADSKVNFFLLEPGEELGHGYVYHDYKYLPLWIVKAEFMVYFEKEKMNACPIEGFSIVMTKEEKDWFSVLHMDTKVIIP